MTNRLPQIGWVIYPHQQRNSIIGTNQLLSLPYLIQRSRNFI